MWSVNSQLAKQAPSGAGAQVGLVSESLVPRPRAHLGLRPAPGNTRPLCGALRGLERALRSEGHALLLRAWLFGGKQQQ